MDTVITKGNLEGDSSGLPDREVVRQAIKNLSMNAKFWALIKLNRIPYKMVAEKLVEASYTEAAKGLKDLPLQSKIFWLTDQEVKRSQDFPVHATEIMQSAEAAKWALEIFKLDFDKKKG